MIKGHSDCAEIVDGNLQLANSVQLMVGQQNHLIFDNGVPLSNLNDQSSKLEVSQWDLVLGTGSYCKDRLMNHT